MATTPKKQKPKDEINNKRLKTALTQLTNLFTLKDLEKKFRVPAQKLSLYKRKRKLKPFDRKKAEQIYNFYRKLKDNRKLEGYQYGFRVKNFYRIKRTLDPIVLKLEEIEEERKERKMKVEEIAQRLGVSPSTIWRWRTEKVKRIRMENVEKINELHEDLIKKIVGIFYILSFRTKKRRKDEYTFIKSIIDFKGSEETLLAYINEGDFTIKDYIIDTKRKISFSETLKFIEHLRDVDKNYRESSKIEVEKFIKYVFSGKELKELRHNIKKYEK